MNFLSDAAHLLRVTAPETSAWLMSRSHELSLSEGLQQTDVQRQRACAACGLIMIPGMGSSVKMEADRTSPKRHGSGKKAGRKRNTKVTLKKVLQCGHCMEKTVIKLEPPPSANRSRKLLRQQETRAATETQAHEATGAVKTAGSASMASSKASTPTPTATTSSANASSKKRAKSRKAGLQALLDQNKNAKGSRSLSLADFSMRR
ncbi:hypothetical protein HYQ44_000516 [Verticillium longisporum]|nr:hypothetical protein HYQ44_000516 [Verticillium longisporum]